jgi:DNA replication factor GINS
MNREDLKNTLRNEQSSEMQSLNSDFFPEVEKYILAIEEEIAKYQTPHSIEKKMLLDELNSALTDIDIIFMRRIKKVTHLATSAAFAQHQLSSPMQNLTADEKELYELIYSAIKKMHSNIIAPIQDSFLTKTNTK